MSILQRQVFFQNRNNSPERGLPPDAVIRGIDVIDASLRSSLIASNIPYHFPYFARRLVRLFKIPASVRSSHSSFTIWSFFSSTSPSSGRTISPFYLHSICLLAPSRTPTPPPSPHHESLDHAPLEPWSYLWIIPSL
ncbi:hypothetical protein [Leptolyngbya sp. 7M]|uniref:hypothetical protein n=1 Tax=Leptolyngbya sp. 7M TaxID=2812896 RepID=UPI001B8CC776|nr:hypothetical protein [Leptolyngbya sp. 7M]QYO66111.1 hypothetical protein JVX88_04740 [Leptolyngbya sp. 7M]